MGRPGASSSTRPGIALLPPLLKSFVFVGRHIAGPMRRRLKISALGHLGPLIFRDTPGRSIFRERFPLPFVRCRESITTKRICYGR